MTQEAERTPDIPAPPPMFFVQHNGDYVYDFILWWRPESKGYTYDLNDAGLYTLEEAQAIIRIRNEETAWSEADARAHVSAAVSIDHLRAAGVTPAATSKLKLRPKPVKPPARNCEGCGEFFSMQYRHPDALHCDFCTQSNASLLWREKA